MMSLMTASGCFVISYVSFVNTIIVSKAYD